MPISINTDTTHSPREWLIYIEMGWRAASEGQWLEDNPFPEHDYRHDAWRIGYRVCPYRKGSKYSIDE